MLTWLAITLLDPIDPASLKFPRGVEFRLEGNILYIKAHWSDIWSWHRLLDGTPFETFESRQHCWVNRGWLDSQKAYWDCKLAGLPLFQPVAKIETFPFRSELTDYNAKLTAFFHALSASPDICIGISAPNRIRIDSESVLGPVSHIVGIRVDASAANLSGLVRQAVLEALQNQDLPQSRLFPAMFLPETVEGVTWLAPRCPADLTWTSDGLEYNPERYTRQEVAHLAAQLAPNRHVAARVHAIAAHLQPAGVGAKTVVALLLERSGDLPAAILAVWQLGGVVLALDPSYPEERLSFMLQDSDAALVLTDRDLAALPESPQSIDQPALYDPDSLAYIIYTSGSSGQPKGVDITHRGLDNLLDTILAETAIGPGDVFVAVTTVAFDIAFMELLLPLRAGASLVIASRETAADGKLLARLLEECGATILFGTPATWRMLIEAGWRGRPDMKILCGGETMTRRLADDLLARGAAVWNLYGPTETTICSTIARVEPGLDPVPIGSPIANTSVNIVDGELLISGHGVARGYRNRPELTAEKFTATGEFRTGDRVRIREDGNLEYLGRLDNQAKIRGNRIEVEEVEAALQKHPGVVMAAVRAADDVLTAYLVGDASPDLLRESLARTLPAFMVPSRFVFLNAMPLTPNGKLDRRALAAAEPADPANDFDPPRTSVEKSVAAIFAEVLHLPCVGRDDDFFHIGGHSLAANQVLSRVWEMWKIELPLRALFDAPTVEALARRIEVLQTPVIVPPTAPRRATALLSFAQQRLWFLDRLYEDDRALYNIPVVIRLSGAFDRVAFTRALNQVVRRHDSLRTNFTDVQVIAAERHIEVPFLNPQEAHGEMYRPFDLERDPLLRAAVVELGPGEYELIVVMHHIISDGWSVGILFREINSFYRGESLPPLTLQYADFAERERSTEPRLDYWRKQLAHAPGFLELPTDRARPARQTFAGGRVTFEFPAGLSSALKAFSRRGNATLFMTLLAGFEALLYRYTGETDLCIGTPVANRNRVELEGLIGFFVNTLVLRSTVTGQMSFGDLLATVRETALDAFAHQDVPFQKLVEALQPERGTSHTPFFQVLFVLQNQSAETLHLPGVKTLFSHIKTDLAKFDLTVNIEITEPAVQGVIEYNRDLFDADRMERLAAHYEVLLTAAVQAPESRVDELPLLTIAEQRSLHTWNGTASEYPQKTFPELFALQVAKAPDRIAAECEGRAWTYAELHAQSNAVAQYIVANGWTGFIGIQCSRSLEMLACMIGVWKAGAAYVPIDPELPEHRQAFIREDAALSGVLTQQGTAGSLAAGPSPAPELSLDTPAYILYTSGSTGTPKGVVIPHRALVNFLFAIQKEIPITQDDVTLAIATVSFDIATLELYLPLLVGARVVIAPDRRDLSQLIATTHPTILQATPATWRMLIEAGWKGHPNTRLISTGEALPRDLANQLLARGASLHNLYGPTETNYSSAARISPDIGPVPIGKPLANTRFQVLDAHRQPVPIGIPGELYISGDNLALGYWNRPELTAEKFLAGTFRTGDLVRYRANGDLEYLRRLDNQVKLRGYRIELGEIEAALLQQTGVQAAAVLICDERLIAYVVADNVRIEGLRRTLAAHLPDYMVPARFILLEALPLTPNGKVDRQALQNLPAPETDLTAAVPPSTPLEELIANAFAHVLDLETVGASDNFFHLGGHSLLATRVVTRLREKLDLEVALRTLFEHPTAQSLARRIEHDIRGDVCPRIGRYPAFGSGAGLFRATAPLVAGPVV